MPRMRLTDEIVNHAAAVAEKLMAAALVETEIPGRANCLRNRARLMVKAIEQYRAGDILIPPAVEQLVNADAYLRWFEIEPVTRADIETKMETFSGFVDVITNGK